jgi:hypothetical protein
MESGPTVELFLPQILLTVELWRIIHLAKRLFEFRFGKNFPAPLTPELVTFFESRVARLSHQSLKA